MRKPKYPNASATVTAFYNAVSDSFNNPGTDEIGDTLGKKKQELVAEEFEISRIKVRKILITTGDLQYPETKVIQELQRDKKTVKEISKILNISPSTINSLLPYEKGVYKLSEVSAAAEKMERYRKRKVAVMDLQEVLCKSFENSEWKIALWKTIIAFQNYPFITSGRGSRPGIKFTYTVTGTSSGSGNHYKGENVDGFGNEMRINGKEKSISRSTVELAYMNTLKMGRVVPGPKALGVPGAHSYLYSLFLRFGVISKE